MQLIDDAVHEYNNTYHSTTKIKSAEVKSSAYIDFGIKLMSKISNLKLVMILEHQHLKNTFAKVYTPNWSEEIFVIKKVKNTVPWTYVLKGLNGEKIVGMFYKKRIAKNKSN